MNDQTDRIVASYEDFIEQTAGSCTVLGIEFDPVRVLRDLDPVTFRVGFHDWADSEGIDTDDLEDLSEYLP